MTDTGSTLTRHSSYTWMRDTCEEEDTCLLATQLRRRYEEVRSRAMQRAEPRQEEVTINKPYDEVLGAAQLIKRVKACKSL